MTSLCTTYWQVFLAQGICVGLGNGLVFIPSITTCSTYFLKNRALALGVAASGSATGGLVYPAIAESLLPKVGFGWTVRVMGLVMGVTMVLCAVFLKPRLPPRRSGPLVEWAAFRELPYALFATGSFLMFWGLYVVFYYIGQYTLLIMSTKSWCSFVQSFCAPRRNCSQYGQAVSVATHWVHRSQPLLACSSP